MQLCDAREIERILDEFHEFDRRLIHLKYQDITDRLGGKRLSGPLF